VFESLTVETEDGDRSAALAWKPLLITPGAVVMFGFMLPKLGMVMSLPLLILASAAWPATSSTGRTRCSTCVVLTLGSWLVFIKGLG
jgi:hypothetical protein